MFVCSARSVTLFIRVVYFLSQAIRILLARETRVAAAKCFTAWIVPFVEDWIAIMSDFGS